MDDTQAGIVCAEKEWSWEVWTGSFQIFYHRKHCLVITA